MFEYFPIPRPSTEVRDRLSNIMWGELDDIACASKLRDYVKNVQQCLLRPAPGMPMDNAVQRAKARKVQFNAAVEIHNNAVSRGRPKLTAVSAQLFEDLYINSPNGVASPGIAACMAVSKEQMGDDAGAYYAFKEANKASLSGRKPLPEPVLTNALARTYRRSASSMNPCVWFRQVPTLPTELTLQETGFEEETVLEHRN